MTQKEFKKIYDQTMASYRETCEAAPWEDKDFYTTWAAQTFFYVSFSSRVISLASAFVPLTKNDLHSRLVKHAGEEEKHEMLALRDLKTLGHSIDSFPELAATSALYQTQFFYAVSGQPSSLMGYFLSLEGLAINVCPKAHERAKGAYGDRAANFLRVHAAEDVEHVEQAFSILKNFGPEELAQTARNLVQTQHHYCQMIKSCEEFALRASRTKAS